MLYDGLCGFCDFTMHWIMKRDKHDRFRFAPQQSAVAASLLERFGVDREMALATNSVYMVLNYDDEETTQRFLAKSDVLVNVLLLLGGGWAVLGRLLQAVPKFLRDGAYSLAARNRYRIAGRYESCPIPTPAERAKFLV
jgi:predicted DCC family thiol-disulfide oxidoreductase YuxK